MMLCLVVVVAACAVMLAGCDSGGARDPAQVACMPLPGGAAVPTMAFRDFLATRPRPAEIRARYGEIAQVVPDDRATRAPRVDCSRFFTDVDVDGKVIDGRFG